MKYPEERLLKDLYVKLPQKTTFKLDGREYTIPEGYEAEIKDGKVVVRKKESEDEKIRKRAIAVLKQQRDYWSYDGPMDKFPPATLRKDLVDAIDVALAYLEKQKELPFVKDVMLGYPGLYFYDGERMRFQGNPAMGKKQKEQKPEEWEDEYREEDLQTRFAFYTYKDEPDILYLSNLFVEELSRGAGFGTRILKAAEKVAETIGATSICVKVKQDSPANKWYRKNGYGYKTFEGEYDWLEKTLEYLKPNKPAEWSEEEKTIIDCAVEVVEKAGLPSLAASLKSLRPQPHTVSVENATKFGNLEYERGVKDGIQHSENHRWKPSEEQMEALYCAIQTYRFQHNVKDKRLNSLYDDLKKL